MKTSMVFNPVGGSLPIKASKYGIMLKLDVGKREFILSHSEAVNLSKLAKGKRKSLRISLSQIHGQWPVDIRFVYGDEFITLHFDKWNWPFPVKIARKKFEALADELLILLEELTA